MGEVAEVLKPAAGMTEAFFSLKSLAQSRPIIGAMSQPVALSASWQKVRYSCGLWGLDCCLFQLDFGFGMCIGCYNKRIAICNLDGASRERGSIIVHDDRENIVYNCRCTRRSSEKVAEQGQGGRWQGELHRSGQCQWQ